MSTHDCNVTSWQRALPPHSNTNRDKLKGGGREGGEREVEREREAERERELQIIQVQSHISQLQHVFFLFAMTIKSHSRLFSAKRTPKGFFCKIKFPSRKCYNNTGADWKNKAVIKKGETIMAQQHITSCCYFQNRYAVEKQHAENSKDICCAFVIPLAVRKQVFSTVIFT